MPMPMKKSMEKPRWPSKAGETLLERDATARVSGEGHVKRRYRYVRATVGVLVVLLAPPPWTVVSNSAAVAAQEPQAEAQTWTPPTHARRPSRYAGTLGCGRNDRQLLPLKNVLLPLRDSRSPAPFAEARKSQIIDPPDGKVPYQPWALAQKQRERGPVH